MAGKMILEAVMDKQMTPQVSHYRVVKLVDRSQPAIGSKITPGQLEEIRPSQCQYEIRLPKK